MRLAITLLTTILLAGCAGRLKMADRPKPPGTPYVDALVERAMHDRLDRSKQWLRLGHYRPERFGDGWLSEADHPRFFLASDGQDNPRAELEATLRGFFLPPVQELPVGKAGFARHPICRFPARLAYLAEALEIDMARLPTQACPRYGKFLGDVNPRSVTLVFSSYFLNNPASAFGHTFLRFNKAQTMAVGQKRELLDYAINFAADVDTGNSVIYAFKGLLGLFPGTTKRMPYYYKVREYSDTESRDIWEYHLDLTPKQLYMLVAHIWEIGHTHFDYFYIDENCSYRIHMMLEAANPEIELIEQLGPAVLPADTVKVLFDNPGLVREVTYRPSLRTELMHKVEALDSEQRDYVERLADRADAPLPGDWNDARKVAVLDAALDLVDTRHVKDLVFKRDPEAARKKQSLLERRADIRVPSEDRPVPVPWGRQPQIGHGSGRLGAGVGLRDADAGLLDGGFLALDFRLALHDLADPSPGYPELAQLEFLPLRLRLWKSEDDAEALLEDFSIVRIVSLTSVSRFDMSMSWHVDFGLRELEGEGCRRCLAGKLRGGTGLTGSFADEAVSLFLTADAAIDLAGESDVGIEGSFVRAGLGPAGGLRLRLDPELILLTRGSFLFYPEQPDPRVWRVDSALRWGLSQNLALSLEGAMLDNRREGQLLLLGYL
ncbi:MAG: DUF4105 domain-containing protein [Myxococcales bacterium]|nr:DUF4105 domain-containing protein [Myxococcales bacterium]